MRLDGGAVIGVQDLVEVAIARGAELGGDMLTLQKTKGGTWCARVVLKDGNGVTDFRQGWDLVLLLVGTARVAP